MASDQVLPFPDTNAPSSFLLSSSTPDDLGRQIGAALAKSLILTSRATSTKEDRDEMIGRVAGGDVLLASQLPKDKAFIITLRDYIQVAASRNLHDLHATTLPLVLAWVNDTVDGRAFLRDYNPSTNPHPLTFPPHLEDAETLESLFKPLLNATSKTYILAQDRNHPTSRDSLLLALKSVLQDAASRIAFSAHQFSPLPTVMKQSDVLPKDRFRPSESFFLASDANSTSRTINGAVPRFPVQFQHSVLLKMDSKLSRRAPKTPGLATSLVTSSVLNPQPPQHPQPQSSSSLTSHQSPALSASTSAALPPPPSQPSSSNSHPHSPLPQPPLPFLRPEGSPKRSTTPLPRASKFAKSSELSDIEGTTMVLDSGAASKGDEESAMEIEGGGSSLGMTGEGEDMDGCESAEVEMWGAGDEEGDLIEVVSTGIERPSFKSDQQPPNPSQQIDNPSSSSSSSSTTPSEPASPPRSATKDRLVVKQSRAAPSSASDDDDDEEEEEDDDEGEQEEDDDEEDGGPPLRRDQMLEESGESESDGDEEDAKTDVKRETAAREVLKEASEDGSGDGSGSGSEDGSEKEDGKGSEKRSEEGDDEDDDEPEVPSAKAPTTAAIGSSSNPTKQSSITSTSTSTSTPSDPVALRRGSAKVTDSRTTVASKHRPAVAPPSLSVSTQSKRAPSASSRASSPSSSSVPSTTRIPFPSSKVAPHAVASSSSASTANPDLNVSRSVRSAPIAAPRPSSKSARPQAATTSNHSPSPSASSSFKRSTSNTLTPSTKLRPSIPSSSTQPSNAPPSTIIPPHLLATKTNQLSSETSSSSKPSTSKLTQPIAKPPRPAVASSSLKPKVFPQAPPPPPTSVAVDQLELPEHRRSWWLGEKDTLSTSVWVWEKDQEFWEDGKRELRAWLALSQWDQAKTMRPVLMKGGEPVVMMSRLREDQEDWYPER